MADKFYGARLDPALWSEVKIAAIKSGKGLKVWVADAYRAALKKPLAQGRRMTPAAGKKHA